MSASIELPKHTRVAITICVILATLMQALDTTIANVALPYMQGSVSASQDEIAWVLTSYIVVAAIMTPPTGYLAGRFGLKRLFLVSVAGFTVSSVLCGMAQSLVQIVLFRVLQGLFGAALVPLSQTVLMNINPKERQGSAIALWGVAVMAGPVLGPVLGGWLTEAYRGPRAGTSGCRHDGRHAGRRKADRAGRYAPPPRCRSWAHGLVVLRDDGLDAGHFADDHHRDRADPGHWSRLHLRTAQRGDSVDD